MLSFSLAEMAVPQGLQQLQGDQLILKIPMQTCPRWKILVASPIGCVF
jgi:hypothetical protein